LSIVTAAAAAVSTVLGGMYLDGKYALRKDIYALRREKAIIKLYMKAGEYPNSGKETSLILCFE
jgi:hypothetical protein